MAQDYTEWLAINVLNEQQLVTYRTLSRALKVHSNLAKQMLYDFHRKQNARKSGAVHATYLITGVQKAPTSTTNGVQGQADGEDTVMQSSPPLPSSSMPRSNDHDEEPILVRKVMLAREEHIEKAKATFDNIIGIHIYSLQANGLTDVQSLTECNRKIAVNCASEDPLEAWKQYGTIQNPNVKRRTQRRQAPPPPPAAKNTATKPKQTASVSHSTATKKEDAKESLASETTAQPPRSKATPEPSKKPASIKRQDSDIFKSFAKGKTKEKKSESQDSGVSTPKPEPEDELMGGFSDEEDADEGAGDLIDELPTVADGKSRKDREAELQAMMEQEDEAMVDIAESKANDAGEVENDLTIDKPESQAPGEPKESVQVENGRRRGRRRVMKKKTVKDEDGYLGKLCGL
jgi:DNA polymerase delta subunit 3